MHRLNSLATVYRFRIAALLLVLSTVLIPAALGAFIYSLLVVDVQLTVISASTIMLAIFMVIIQWGMARRARCPLCMTPVMETKRCSKHRNAKPFLGSYRLRVALSIIFKGSFRCPFCHEPTAIQVRQKRL